MPNGIGVDCGRYTRFQYKIVSFVMFLYIQAPHLIGKKLEVDKSKWYLNCDHCLIATWTEAFSSAFAWSSLFYTWTGY